MTETQLCLAIGVPILFNTALFTLFTASVNKRLDDFRAHMDTRFTAMDSLFTEKLRRVEEIVDARLTRIEDHLHLK